MNGLNYRPFSTVCLSNVLIALQSFLEIDLVHLIGAREREKSTMQVEVREAIGVSELQFIVTRI